MHIKIFSHHRWADVKTNINQQLEFLHHQWAEVKISINEQYDI
jgi:hypothetical protein